MKLYLSADIEGIAGITAWKEAKLGVQIPLFRKTND